MSNVIRVIKNCNYTTLSNIHFKDKRLSWKAKGLLSTMLSLPEDWNYTIEGLSSLSDDGIKATNSGLAELEKYGYLIRKQLRDDRGHFVMMEYTIYEKPIEQDTQPNPEEEITEPIIGSFPEEPLCQNGQTDENRARLPLCQNRQTGNRKTEKGMLLNTNILSTKELNTNNISSSSDQNETRRRYLLNEEEEQRLREQLRIKSIAERCSPNLVEAVFRELCRREYDFCKLMTDRAMEQVCLAIQEKQQSEPIRMLPNLINVYLDNIMLGIRAASGGEGTLCQTARGNPFNRYEQHKYDFDSLEKEILSN